MHIFNALFICCLFQLFVAGALGIYVCANDYENYIGSSKNFALKVGITSKKVRFIKYEALHI